MSPADREALTQTVKLAEGFRANAYLDSLGVWTIGYGTNLQTLRISEPQAQIWLTQRLIDAEQDSERLSWYARLSPIRQQAIVELLYNMGATHFRTFRKLDAALEVQDYETAGNELLDSRWAEQVGPVRALRLAKMLKFG